MSSRVLGEDVEIIRDSISIGEVDGDCVGSIQGRKCDDKKELFDRSVIATATSSLSSNQILNHILT